ncbi:MAG: hypothetical protein RIQ47_1988 [Bacteroidota bacterium]
MMIYSCNGLRKLSQLFEVVLIIDWFLGVKVQIFRLNLLLMRCM